MESGLLEATALKTAETLACCAFVKPVAPCAGVKPDTTSSEVKRSEVTLRCLIMLKMLLPWFRLCQEAPPNQMH